jgi:hypothetical protein
MADRPVADYGYGQGETAGKVGGGFFRRSTTTTTTTTTTSPDASATVTITGRNESPKFEPILNLSYHCLLGI